ncbi:MAG: rod shape-determining protein [Lachnospiraceae bacterium]|nr:rod shape-determining protein [Lachnospiraceae bacterium]
MSNAYGIDLGTNNLKIYDNANDSILNISNTIAVINDDQMYSYGDDAYSMFEKAPDNIDVSFPISSGVIADFDNIQTMLFKILESDLGARLKNSDITIAVPTDITEVEKKAFQDLFIKSKTKVRNIRLCEKPIADALGIGIDVTEPTGVMVVDIGGDTTEISVVSLGGIVQTQLLEFGGNLLDESIVTHLKRKFNLLIGRKTAKQLKENIGAAKEGKDLKSVIVGRNVVSGLPVEFEVESDEVFAGIKADLTNICGAVKRALEKVPPELAKDIVHSGIYLTGGGANLSDLAEFFNEETNIKVNVCEDSSETVVKGLNLVASEDKFKRFGFVMQSKIFG